MYLKNINNHILKIVESDKDDLINNLQMCKATFNEQLNTHSKNNEETLQGIENNINESNESLNEILEDLNQKKTNYNSLKSNLSFSNQDLECEITTLKDINTNLNNSLSNYLNNIEEINEKIEGMKKFLVLVDGSGDDYYLDKEELNYLNENNKIDESTFNMISNLDLNEDNVNDIDQEGVNLPALAKMYDEDDTLNIFT